MDDQCDMAMALTKCGFDVDPEVGKCINISKVFTYLCFWKPTVINECVFRFSFSSYLDKGVRYPAAVPRHQKLPSTST